MTCGVCLKEDVEVINIFGDEGKRLQISAVIRQHFWFEPIEDDTILSRICCPCWENIVNFHVFYTNVKNAHKQLSERFYTNSQFTTDDNSPDYYQQQEQFPNLSNKDQPECTYGYDNLEGDDNVDNTNREDILQQTNDGQICTDDAAYDNKHNQRNQETSRLTNGRGQGDKQGLLARRNSREIDESHLCDIEVNNCHHGQQITEANSSKSTNNITKKSCKTFENKLINRDTLSLKKDPRNKGIHRKKDENRQKEEDDIIAKYIKLECEMCFEMHPNFYDLSKHYQIMHNMSGYVRCCDKKLPSRAYALDHINQHLNPDSYTCKECNKTFASKYAIKNHMAIKHAPEDEKIYTCDYCPERFTNEHALNVHCTRHISDEEKRVYCIDCREIFPTALALQMHKNVYHGKLQGHICHVCGRIIRGKSFFAKHVNEHAVQLGQETINDPVCPICGKLSASIKTLRHHIRYVHSSHRPHKCNICGKAFKIRQKLREHMGSHAVGNPIKCPYCHKSFRSKIHLYSHKYRMHKKEYEEEKLVRLNMGTESLNCIENSTVIDENDVNYDNSIVLSEDSSPEDDDCYVVS